MADPVLFRELPSLVQAGLRGDPADPAFAAAARVALDLAIPVAPNTVSRQGDVSVLWLGPDEWLVAGGSADLPERLRAALAGVHAAVVELSASRAVFELTGPAARDVLAKGCALDVHPRAFGPGQCAQTGLARAAVILEQVDAAPTFRIFVRRSFARYLATWLADAAAELAPAIP
jgi:sarcosine oxidase subunit gamma